MSVYSVKGKGWRYDFTLKGIRHTEAWFKTKADARKAEVERREELKNPKPVERTSTDMAFLELVNRRLDHVQAYNSDSHYSSYTYMARRWIKHWGSLLCSEITLLMVQDHLNKRRKVSAYTANQDLRYLRATFNWGLRKKLDVGNPTDGVDFFPTDKPKKYVPPKEDVLTVVWAGDQEAQQYLWTILLTAGRVGEINNLTWDDINFDQRVVTLWTRKRKGGNREPREVPMIDNLYDILSVRFEMREPGMPWVFWHTYWSRKQGKWVKGPYRDRKRLMRSLCDKAKVKYFRFHALRHLTASILDDLGVHIGVIQRILGHQNRRTTEIYLHSIGEAERDAMAKLKDSRLFKDMPKTDPKAPINQPTSFYARKVDRPPHTVLKAEIEKLGFAATGRKYGVSDNAIRKWIRAYERDESVRLSRKNSHTDSHTDNHKQKRSPRKAT
jgi:integrase